MNISNAIINVIKFKKPDNWSSFILDVLFLIGFLALLTYKSYDIGYNNGQINQCNEIGNIKLQDGSCIPKIEYENMINLQNTGYKNFHTIGDTNESMELFAIN
jgi:hypothetical protein